MNNGLAAFLGCAKLFAKKLKKDAVSAYSANAAFFIIVSIFPFSILLFKLIDITSSETHSVILSLIENFPQQIYDFLYNTLEDIQTATSSVTVISIAIVGTVLSASKGIFALIYGLNRIANADETRSYVASKVIAVIYTVALIVTLWITLILLIFGNFIFSHISSKFPILNDFSSFFLALRYLLGASLLTFFFLILYTFGPNRNSKMKYSIPGAVCCTVGWIGFSTIYSYYIDNIADFSIYGSLSSIVLLMLWLYFCMYILLIGAEINVIFEPLLKDDYTSHRRKDKKQ